MRDLIWLLLLVAGCGGAPEPRRAEVTPQQRKVVSNVLRSDYVGSAACATCHPAAYRAWHDSPMRRMTRDQAHAEIAAPFDGRSLQLGPDRGSFELREGRRFLALTRSGEASLFRITKVIGGRYREDFVGEEVATNDPLGPALEPERVLPVSFLRFDGTLRYKGYSVMVPERQGLEPGLVWQRACILCHNTAPQLVAWYDELMGNGAGAYQGSASNELPRDKAFRYVVDDPEGLRRALEQELHLIGAHGRLPAEPRQALSVAISNTRERFGEQALLELGVGCESCHGGARAHVASPEHVRTSFAAQSSLLHIETAAGETPSRAQDINRTCAKCHTVLFSQYPYTWEGGERRRNPGGSTTNSGEARDFLLGGCASALACSVCHDPHAEDAKQRLDALATLDGNRTCTSCHRELASEARLERHSHHAPQGAGSVCLNCHMPKKNMGLAYELTRYHRIGSPTDEARVLGDRPLECALCHADRSVDQIVRTMEKWWGKRYDRAQLERLYGPDLRVNPLRATLSFGKPHEQVVAASVAAERGLEGTLDPTVNLLSSPYPLVRYFARHSLERRFGAPLSLDMNLPGPELLLAGRSWVTEQSRRGAEPEKIK